MSEVNTEIKRVSRSITGKGPGEFRPGKTKRDRANKAQERNASNKAQRADWNNETTGKRSNEGKSFPYGTCNGKRNRALKNKGK